MTKLKCADVAKYMSKSNNAEAVYKKMDDNGVYKSLVAGHKVRKNRRGKRLDQERIKALRKPETPEMIELKATLAKLRYKLNPDALIDLLDDDQVKHKIKKAKKKQYLPSTKTNPFEFAIHCKKTGRFRTWSGLGTAPTCYKEAAAENNVKPNDSMFNLYIHSKGFSNTDNMNKREEWAELFPDIPHPIKQYRKRKSSLN